MPPEGLTVGEVAELLAVNPGEVVKALFMRGVMAQVNQTLDVEAVRLAAASFGVEAIAADAEVRRMGSLLAVCLLCSASPAVYSLGLQTQSAAFAGDADRMWCGRGAGERASARRFYKRRACVGADAAPARRLRDGPR